MTFWPKSSRTGLAAFNTISADELELQNLVVGTVSSLSCSSIKHENLKLDITSKPEVFE